MSRHIDDIPAFTPDDEDLDLPAGSYPHEQRLDDAVSLGAQIDRVRRHALAVVNMLGDENIDLHRLSSKASLLANAADGVSNDADLIAERGDTRWLSRDFMVGAAVVAEDAS